MFKHLVGFHNKPIRMPTIGKRELELLDVLWQVLPKAKSAIEIQEQIAATHFDGDISVNTVQSTLERLVKKGLLERSKKGRAYYYCAIVTKKEMICSLIRDIASDMSSGDTQLMVSGFMEFLTNEDPQMSKKLAHAFADIEDAK